MIVLLIICALVLLITCGFVEWVIINDDIETLRSFATSRTVYDASRLNYFGATVVAILVDLLFIPYFVLLFIYWIFHVGRKENKS